jgi:hypothetical protein
MPIDLLLKQKAMEYFVTKGIESDLFDSSLHNSIDVNLLKKPMVQHLIPHPALSSSVNVTEDSTNTLMIFTDGFKYKKRVGAGFYVYRETTITEKAKFKLSTYCSQFQAQLYVILMSTKYLNRYLDSEPRITIVINSVSTL